MTPWFEAAIAKWGWIWIGLTFGFAAKYALLLKRGVHIRPVLVLADVLLMPMVALIAYSIVARFGVDGETAALLTALATVCADRLVKLLTERFLKQVETEVGEVAKAAIGQARQVVQVEQSAKHIIDDTINGTAPDEYDALKPHPKGDV